MASACSQPAASLQPACSQSAASLQPVCGLSTACLQPVCSLSTASLPPACSQPTASLQPVCSQSAASLQPVYSQSAASAQAMLQLSVRSVIAAQSMGPCMASIQSPDGRYAVGATVITVHRPVSVPVRSTVGLERHYTVLLAPATHFYWNVDAPQHLLATTTPWPFVELAVYWLHIGCISAVYRLYIGSMSALCRL